MTPEQKKLVPQHLRGAGKRRYWCKYCNTYHGYLIANCKNNPNYARNKASREKASSEKAKQMYRDGHGKVLNEAYRRWLELPGSRELLAANMSKVAKNMKRHGKHNHMFGKKHSLETRLKMSTSLSRVKNILRPEDLERVVLPPTIPTSSSFDFFRRTTTEPIHEFSTSEILERWNSGDFDPFS